MPFMSEIIFSNCHFHTKMVTSFSVLSALEDFPFIIINSNKVTEPKNKITIKKYFKHFQLILINGVYTVSDFPQ